MEGHRTNRSLQTDRRRETEEKSHERHSSRIDTDRCFQAVRNGNSRDSPRQGRVGAPGGLVPPQLLHEPGPRR